MPIKIEAAHRLLATKDNRLFYRGLMEAWSDERAKNQHLIFVTPDKEYALEYAKDENHVLAFHVDIGNAFDFGFRSLQTEVQLSEIISRIKKGILDQFQHHHISQKEGVELVKELADIKATGHKRVWEWYMQMPILVKLLAKAGFDSIEGREGLGDDVPTYGLFSSNQLTRVKP